jgi:RNAse (barnase) inhibitor barstar
MLTSVTVDCAKISDWDTFHDAFAQAFGFPDFYGRNLSAWTDCMTRLDEDFSSIQVAPGGLVVLDLANADILKRQAPAILAELLEMAAFVNWRRIKAGGAPILILSGYA